MKRSAVLFAAAVLATSATAQAADKKKCLDSAPRGQELRDQGKLVEAREQFLICADPACPPPIPTYCAEWLEELKLKLPSIVLRISDASGKDLTDAVVTIDGKPVKADGKPVDLDPGTHTLHVTRTGSGDVDQAVVAAAGEHGRVVSVKLEDAGAAPATTTPAPAATASASSTGLGAKIRAIPTGALIGWGVGAVGLIGFGVFGIKANVDYGHYESSCGSHCAPSARDDVAGTMVIADVFLAVGLVGAAVGTVLYLMAPPPPVERQARNQR